MNTSVRLTAVAALAALDAGTSGDGALTVPVLVTPSPVSTPTDQLQYNAAPYRCARDEKNDSHDVLAG